MNGKTIILAGRGPSIYDFDWPTDVPVMAISSGVFAIPEGHRCDHFVTLDAPKFFMEPIHDDGEGGISWTRDDESRHWPFWLDTSIQKHTTANRLKPMQYKTVPPEVLDHVPEKYIPALCREILKAHHALGFQPTWADYSPVQAWPMLKELAPNFTDDGPFGLSGVCNSLFFGIQIAHRMGYKRLLFAGVDLNGDHYESHRETFARWSEIANEHGFEWLNSGHGSALSEILPTEMLAA